MHNENAYAKFKTPITMADYEKSRVIADPLRLLDCVMFCDGANAFLVTTGERARAMGITKMVYPTAYAEVTNFNGNQPLVGDHRDRVLQDRAERLQAVGPDGEGHPHVPAL